jgi:peptidyl-tRNA hydrolase, PTH1 family
LIVGLGNPGREYEGTRHNVGFMVAQALAERWDLGRGKDRFRGRFAEGRVPAPEVAALAPGATTGAGARGPRVAVLCPQTFMNDAGRSVGPARGALKLPLERVLVVHDEIDLPFGEVRTRLGGGLAGHNGLKSIKRELGGADFMRVRVGVGRPDSTDPEIVSAYVLGRFREPHVEVAELVERASEHAERLVLGEEP